MNEIQLFSLRRTIILSLILGLFTMVIVGQALETGNPSDETGNPSDETGNDQLSSTTTSTSETSTTTSTATQTEIQTSTAKTGTYAEDLGNQEITRDASGDFDSASVSSIGDSFNKMFSFSLQFLFTSSLFFGMLATFYIFVYNNSELKEYINQSLNQAGFHRKISSFGKRWVIEGQVKKFSMNIMGFRNLRMKIELPQDVDTDPREFGLRRLVNSASTLCDLEVLPMRLQVVKMYLTKIG